MATNQNVSVMVMYEDESVYARYADGSELHLAPCGCEFVMAKAPDPRVHPLQPVGRVRQRTRFSVSTYKNLMVEALAFRNTYASQPYLPEEIIPAAHKKPFVGIDTEVEWPNPSSCDVQRGPGGEAVVRSVEGRAALRLSSSAEEFSVEFTCSLSRARNHRSLSKDADAVPDRLSRSRPCSPQDATCRSAQPKPEEMYKCLTVVQHHSCSSVAPGWRYPLSLARRHCAKRRSETSEDSGPDGGWDSGHEKGGIDMSDINSNERWSRLPEALPLGCPAPHLHRWKMKDALAQGEECSDQDFPEELVKVMWCQGVIYRILNGAIPVIEVSPGDGSVIRSNGILSSYFIHRRNEPHSGEVREVTYHASGLPPDVPGQRYSVSSVVSRASRILTCYNQARNSTKLLGTPSCLQQEQEQDQHLYEPVAFQGKAQSSIWIEPRIAIAQEVQNRSDVVAAELEKIKRFNFLLENSVLHRGERSSPEGERSTSGETAVDPMSELCIAEALQRTTKAIHDIDTLLSEATLTCNSASLQKGLMK